MFFTYSLGYYTFHLGVVEIMKKTKYKLIVWDLDGTLLDTSEGIIYAVIDTIEQAGFPPLPQKQLKTFIGPPIQESFAKALKISVDEAVVLANMFRECYKQKYVYIAKPYDGLIDLIKELSAYDIRHCIATYKRQDLAEQVMEYFNFTKYIDYIVGSDYIGKLTKRDIVEKALRHYINIPIEQIVLIGDSNSDFKAAQQLKLDFIAVSYGYGFTNDDIEINDIKGAKDVDGLKKILI